MPHEFTPASDDALQGTWFKKNGRRYCAWRYQPETKTLETSRGGVVRKATLQAETHSLEELKAQLPQMALELAARERDEA